MGGVRAVFIGKTTLCSDANVSIAYSTAHIGTGGAKEGFS